MEKRRKKKKGHVAIPFLLAFLIAIVGMGGIAIYLFNQLDGSDDPIKLQSSVSKPTAADDMTLLFVLDEENDHEPLSFLLARVRPSEKSIMLVGLPSNMLSVVDGRQDTLAGFYSNSGIQTAQTAILNETKIQTDRYIILNSEGFQKICNIFGGAYYQIPAGTEGFVDSAEPQFLGPSQIEKLITYPMFPQGELERSSVTSDLICEMINQTDYERIVSSMDSNFKKLINMMDTNISSIDYSDHKSALKYMFTYGKNIAVFRIPTGVTESEGDVFILDSNFYNGISEFFEEPKEMATLQTEE